MVDIEIDMKESNMAKFLIIVESMCWIFFIIKSYLEIYV